MDRGAWWAMVHGVARVGHDPPPTSGPLAHTHARKIGQKGCEHLKMLRDRLQDRCGQTRGSYFVTGAGDGESGKTPWMCLMD